MTTITTCCTVWLLTEDLLQLYLGQEGFGAGSIVEFDVVALLVSVRLRCWQVLVAKHAPVGLGAFPPRWLSLFIFSCCAATYITAATLHRTAVMHGSVWC